jgi:NAD(P)H-hydrate epimerase
VRRISISEAQAFDLFAQKKLGIPSLILMENAGRGVAEEARRMLRGKKRVGVVCGTGNNGGDGLVAARHLLNAGLKVKVFILGQPSKIKADPKINLNILKNMGQKIVWVKQTSDLRAIEKTDLIIDAIFGIGLREEVKPPFVVRINHLNQIKVKLLAVDVPSGLHADTGKILGAAVRAQRTITFIAAKKGFYRGAGRAYCGKIVVKDIGVVLPQ